MTRGCSGLDGSQRCTARCAWAQVRCTASRHCVDALRPLSTATSALAAALFAAAAGGLAGFAAGRLAAAAAARREEAVANHSPMAKRIIIIRYAAALHLVVTCFV